MRIVEVVNSMISQKAKISHVIKSGDEMYFLFNKKYKWSIRKDTGGNYHLFFYPHETYELKDLINASLEDDEYAVYSSLELKTREANESFADLYRILIEKLFKLDDVFNDIIESDEDKLPW